ncbi:MAG: DNA translocase FtsK, partial [Lachnospiraceae bacterium]|nr:DNA translocase FtsK [Lachnospiraceae bacterium]
MSAQKNFTAYQFPTLGLLKKSYPEKMDVSRLKTTALIIQQTLLKFGLKVTVVDINVGTRFTRYEIRPEQGVRVKDIIRRENEIRIATAARSIHIEAPILGKFAIGIDILNECNIVVAIREIIESDTFQMLPSNLTFAVGRDIIGNVVVSDIAKMQHLLIAGTTGSGKTACIDSIIMSILYKTSPAEVKMILIDTKMSSMSVYNGIPHLIIPVVTDAIKACAALNWAVTEMNGRYKKFADVGVKDLKGYNKSVEMGRKTPHGDLFAKLPQILVIIDDLY